MSKFILLLLKILSTIAATIAGILGILGKSTTEAGNLTTYGKTNFLILVISLLIGVIITIIEFFNDRRKELTEQKRVEEELKIQNKILKDIQRSIYTIDSIDIVISIQFNISYDTRLRKYRKKLDAFIKKCIEDGKATDIEYDPNLTKVVLEPDKISSRSIEFIDIKKGSPFYPSSDITVDIALSPDYNILITENINFDKLDALLEECPYVSQHLNLFCDLAYYAPTKFEDDANSITYYPNKHIMNITTKINDVQIEHDNGKIVSVHDLFEKYLIIFSSHFSDFYEHVKLDELQIKFNKSSNKHYNSLVVIKTDQYEFIKGRRWAAYVYKIKSPI